MVPQPEVPKTYNQMGNHKKKNVARDWQSFLRVFTEVSAWARILIQPYLRWIFEDPFPDECFC